MSGGATVFNTKHEVIGVVYSPNGFAFWRAVWPWSGEESHHASQEAAVHFLEILDTGIKQLEQAAE